MKNNILVINDSTDDGTLNYKKSKLDNTVNYFKEITDIDQLNTLYEMGENPFSFDTVNCISLITADNEEISIHKSLSFINLKFIKISDHELTDDNTIFISLENNHYINNDFQWQTELRLIEDCAYTEQFLHSDFKSACAKAIEMADYDVAGYFRNQTILKEISTRPVLGKVPAISYCHDLNITINDIVYQGYLPAIGQLHLIFKYRNLINYILSRICSNDIDFSQTNYWSSSEIIDAYVWAIKNNQILPALKTARNNGIMPKGFCTLPFFKPIKITK